MSHEKRFNKALGGALIGSAIIEAIIGISTREAVHMLIAAVLGVGGWKVWRAHHTQQSVQ